MRCDECKTEPLTPGHFCECCGRKLSLQERKALDENQLLETSEEASQTSWGEPAPVLTQAHGRADRLVGVHFAPEPYVGPGQRGRSRRSTPILSASRRGSLPSRSLSPCPRRRSGQPRRPEPTVPAVAHEVIDPMLEAHFAGLAPVEAPPIPQVAVPVPVLRSPHLPLLSCRARLLMHRPLTYRPRISTATLRRLAARVAVDRLRMAICVRHVSTRFILCSTARSAAPAPDASRRLQKPIAPVPRSRRRSRRGWSTAVATRGAGCANGPTPRQQRSSAVAPDQPRRQHM